jgi:CBS domain-containing protein
MRRESPVTEPEEARLPESFRVREAMVPNPRTLPATASAQEAAIQLSRPDVRAVIVVDGERLVGTLTQETLVSGVVAAGSDPATTRVGQLVEGDPARIDADASAEEAYTLFEDLGVERLPVVEEGRLVGVLSRSVLQRRLAEDEPPPPEPEAELP